MNNLTDSCIVSRPPEMPTRQPARLTSMCAGAITALALLAAALPSAKAKIPAANFGERQPTLTELTSTLRVGTEFFLNRTETKETVEKHFRLMHDSGITVFRICVIWDDIERTPGVWNLEGHQWIYDAAARKGIKIAATLCTEDPPGWMNMTTFYHQRANLDNPELRTWSQNSAMLPEETEWTWEVRPAHVDPSLPNVLLLGDSISRNYFASTSERLQHVANVYLLATSASLGDPRLPKQIADFCATESVPFRVVHMNNGMHGWTYTEKQYKDALPEFLKTVRRSAPGAQLIWASTTPVKIDTSPGPSNARVDARNAIAEAFFRAHRVSIDDQHALMTQHLNAFKDSVHFSDMGAAIQAEQVVTLIQSALAKR